MSGSAGRTGLRAAAAAAAVGLLVSGCHYGRGMAFREVVVQFTAQATETQHRAVQVACNHFSEVSPEPIPTGRVPQSTRQFDVRYRVDNASDYDLQQLYTCLMHEPGVLGVDMPDLTQ